MYVCHVTSYITLLVLNVAACMACVYAAHLLRRICILLEPFTDDGALSGEHPNQARQYGIESGLKSTCLPAPAHAVALQCSVMRTSMDSIYAMASAIKRGKTRGAVVSLLAHAGVMSEAHSGE